MTKLPCRFCQQALNETFLDLGASPLSNAFLKPEDLERMEPYYPLHARVCSSCFLVQLGEFESPEQIFSDYAYFSSYSTSWLNHAETYAEAICQTLQLGDGSQVVEIASNDGYLLQYFQKRGIPVLGIEPAHNVAQVALAKDIPTQVHFFGETVAQDLLAQGYQADLMVANNVLAHVPDLNDFVAGFKVLLKPQGVITFEFPHLLALIQERQFDTIYHEHFSYFSLLSVQRVLQAHQLDIFDIDSLSTHGGSLRVYVQHLAGERQPSQALTEMLSKEQLAGLEELSAYQGFSQSAVQVKCDLLRFFIQAQQEGKQVVGYGAPAKGNTLLNYCGIGPELLAYTVDRNPYKQGRFLPGSRIPIVQPERIFETQPDYVLILPWNLKTEIIEQLAAIRSWGGRFVTPIPQLEVF